MGKGTQQTQLVTTFRASQLLCFLSWEHFVENCLHSPFLCQISGFANFYPGRAHFDATFPIFLQRYLPCTSTGLSLQPRPRRATLRMGKSRNFCGHFLLLKLQLCISNAEMPCSKNLASDKDSFEDNKYMVEVNRTGWI